MVRRTFLQTALAWAVGLLGLRVRPVDDATAQAEPTGAKPFHVATDITDNGEQVTVHWVVESVEGVPEVPDPASFGLDGLKLFAVWHQLNDRREVFGRTVYRRAGHHYYTRGKVPEWARRLGAKAAA
jgi:hypothetical protein